jgi:UDP-N-acetylmuramyl pentapeptide synthase
MKDRINVPIIEITGVKGKTTTAAMLKEIYRDQNPLILSSRGVEILKDGEEIILKKDISITPASIITAWELAEKFYNGETLLKEGTPSNVGICIFETSLGGTGLADVGVITNIAEDYSIAQESSSASKAKSQMFKSKMVVCDYESYQNIYSKNQNYARLSLKQRINTYSIEEKSNVKSFNINYGLYKTTFQVEVADLQTLGGRCLNTSFEASTFAPAQYHLENTLSAITAALTMGTPIKSITQGMENFRGLPGRTSIRNIMQGNPSLHSNIQGKPSICNNNLPSNSHGVRVIEEINPGINVTAIKRAVNMIKDYENPTMVLGGNYGVTCEEIDEKSLMEFLGKIDDDIHIILTGELGKSLWDKMGRDSIYRSQIDQAVNLASEGGAKNILLVYRSNFADLSKR